MEKCNKDCENCDFLKGNYCLWFLRHRITFVDCICEEPLWLANKQELSFNDLVVSYENFILIPNVAYQQD